MKCPHCRVAFHEERTLIDLEQDVDGHWALAQTFCPTCKRMVLTLMCGTPSYTSPSRSNMHSFNPYRESRLVRPRGSQRPPAPAPVVLESAEIAADYEEACLVLPDSAKASAALSRRCLQAVLWLKGGTKKKDLSDAIQDVLDSKQLPSHLSHDLDAVRNIGNFGAHTQKSTATGEILDVEPGEAEWNLDVLEGLFDFYFVGPAIAAARRNALNKKLKEAGKPEMKKP